MAVPLGRLCRPLLNAVKNNVPKATYVKNVQPSEYVLKNKKRTIGRHSRAKQQQKAALKTFTDEGMAYVTSKDQVLALARCHYKEKKRGEEEEEGDEEGEEEEEEAACI